MSLGLTAAQDALGVEYTLLKKIVNPLDDNAAFANRFGASITVVGDKIVIGAINSNLGAREAGALFVFDRNGNPLRTIPNPEPGPDKSDWFGWYVTAVGNDKVLATAFQDDTGAKDAGSAYLLDLDGNLLQTYRNPDPQPNGLFGARDVASNGDLVAIGAINADAAAPEAGATYLFDLDGHLVQTLVSPNAQFGGDLGRSVEFLDHERIMVSDFRDDTLAPNSGAVFLFDLSGNLLGTLYNPAPNPDVNQEVFGGSIALVGDNILIGASQKVVDGIQTGEVFLFDHDGKLLKTIPDPEPADMNWFGWSLSAVTDHTFIIGSIFNDGEGMSAGKAFLYDTDGNLLQTLVSPVPGPLQHFGEAFAMAGQDLLIGEDFAIGPVGPGGYPFGYGAVWMYQPVSIPGDADLDGVVGLSDFAILKQHFGSGDRFRTGDFDQNMKVDLSDFGILKANFGTRAAVPEPASAVLLFLGMLIWTARQRQRLLMGCRSFAS
ncbi:MAG: PEP-CTERM sorting domain-containing protein [Pirellulales bacterium]